VRHQSGAPGLVIGVRVPYVSLSFHACLRASFRPRRLSARGRDARNAPPDSPSLVIPSEAPTYLAPANTGASDPGVRPGRAGAGAPDTPQPIDFDDAANIVAASAACLPTLSNTPIPGEPGVTSHGVTLAGTLEA
jgi:hypothetical protein